MISDSVLEQLDRAVRTPGVSDQVAVIVGRVMAKLQAGHNDMAWETVDLSLFKGALPAGIASCWVFVIRAGARTGAERHPNSHQRSLSLVGRGEFQLRPEREWERRPLSSQPNESLERRWVSIPANTWHRLVVGREPWAMLSFHTVPAADLIEETPVSPDALDRGATERRHYADLA